MEGSLYLIRHGKAGAAQRGKNDFYRPLTETGQTEWREFLQTMKPLIETENLHVWTSPLLRAKQTTDIFNETFQIDSSTEKDFLVNGDLQACLNNLQELEQPFRVACIGHEPYLTAWLSELTRKRVKVDKGTILKIDFKDNRATLDWRQSPNRKGLFN